MDLLSSDNCDNHCNDPDEDIDQSVDFISHGFNQQINLDCNEDDNNKEEDTHEEEDTHDEDDFTFMLIGNDDHEDNYDEKLFEDNNIRPVFPLFDQNLLLDGEYDIEEIDQLPVMPPVDKIFIESPRGYPSSKPLENNDAATGPYCEWSKESATTTTTTAELNKKSNSTGFSKLWRLKEIVGRSNSDGRDAFVFLKSSDHRSTTTATATTATATTATAATTTATKTTSTSKGVSGEGTFVKVNVAGGKARVVKQGTRAKKPTVSAHEAYLKSRGHTEEERRRSYLPYRPELMGLFTNVHGGLSKNVHPY